MIDMRVDNIFIAFFRATENSIKWQQEYIYIYMYGEFYQWLHEYICDVNIFLSECVDFSDFGYDW